jgi:hypothetical protein
MSLNLFNQYGAIRGDLLTDEATVAAIEALPDETRKILFDTISAVTANVAAEERIHVARAEVRKKEAIYNDAVALDYKSNPPANHASALRAVIDSNAGRKPERVKINKKTRDALAEADLALAEARAELNRATHALRPLQIAAGRAINAWRDCLTTPSADAVTRAYIKAGDDERARRVAEGLPAVPPKIVPPHQSEIDRVMSARGKTPNRLPVYRGR